MEKEERFQLAKRIWIYLCVQKELSVYDKKIIETFINDKFFTVPKEDTKKENDSNKKEFDQMITYAALRESSRKDASEKISIAVIDIFEHLLDKHNIIIPDDEREGDDTEAAIYGCTYGNLKEDIIECVNKILKAPTTIKGYLHDKKDKQIKAKYHAFKHGFKPGPIRKIHILGEDETHTPFIERYRCKCGKMFGKQMRDKVCDECHSKVSYIDYSLGFRFHDITEMSTEDIMKILQEIKIETNLVMKPEFLYKGPVITETKKRYGVESSRMYGLDVIGIDKSDSDDHFEVNLYPAKGIKWLTNRGLIDEIHMLRQICRELKEYAKYSRIPIITGGQGNPYDKMHECVKDVRRDVIPPTEMDKIYQNPGASYAMIFDALNLIPMNRNKRAYSFDSFIEAREAYMNPLAVMTFTYLKKRKADKDKIKKTSMIPSELVRLACIDYFNSEFINGADFDGFISGNDIQKIIELVNIKELVLTTSSIPYEVTVHRVQDGEYIAETFTEYFNRIFNKFLHKEWLDMLLVNEKDTSFVVHELQHSCGKGTKTKLGKIFDFVNTMNDTTIFVDMDIVKEFNVGTNGRITVRERISQYAFDGNLDTKNLIIFMKVTNSDNPTIIQNIINNLRIKALESRTNTEVFLVHQVNRVTDEMKYINDVSDFDFDNYTCTPFITRRQIDHDKSHIVNLDAMSWMIKYKEPEEDRVREMVSEILMRKYSVTTIKVKSDDSIINYIYQKNVIDEIMKWIDGRINETLFIFSTDYRALRNTILSLRKNYSISHIKDTYFDNQIDAITDGKNVICFTGADTMHDCKSIKKADVLYFADGDVDIISGKMTFHKICADNKGTSTIIETVN